MLELPWNDGTLRLPIPDHWNVLDPFHPRHAPAEAEPEILCRQGLQQAIGAQPLHERDLRGKRVLLVCDDVSRPTPVHRFFGMVRETLEQAGVARANIEILFALGVHRPMTQAEAEAKIGPANLAGHRWHNHDAFNPEQLLDLGTTSRGTPVQLNKLLGEFDLIILLGAIEPHILLGFGGGFKMLLPGCAGAATIGRNHLQGTRRGRFNYVGAHPEDSPMRLDLEEGCSLLQREVFLVNAVLNDRGEIERFFCGNPLAAFRAGVQHVQKHFAIATNQEVDIAITASSPLDADLRQAMKCLGNSQFAVRPRGLVLGFLNCREGLGDMPLPRWTLSYPLLRFLVRLARKQRLLMWLRFLRRRDPIEQLFLTHFGLQMLRRNDVWIYSHGLAADIGQRVGAFRQYNSVAAMFAAAEKHVGRVPTVAVFPRGGATYVPARGEGL